MKAHIFTFFVSILFISTTPVMANNDHEHDSNEHEERVLHYVGEKPTTVKGALAELQSKTNAVEKILKKESLDDNDLESVHEVSYSLEAAVDFLRTKQQATQEEALDDLDEAVQAIHYASENHEEAKTRKWYLILRNQIKHVASVF
jgi:hypothetical protein